MLGAMKAYVLTEERGIDSVQLVDRPDPEPGPGQVTVAVRATSLNYRDLMMTRRGQGIVPLSDGAGDVVAVGEGVTDVQVGDRVAGLFFQTWQRGPLRAEHHDSALGGAVDGMLAEYVTLDASGVIGFPDHFSYADAATLPCAALTAWNAIVEDGEVTVGDTILLLGTGGVSIFGLQIASIMGLRSIITSSSDEKLDSARKLGADETINYLDTPEWGKKVLELTDGRGADLILEVGGAGTMPQSLVAGGTNSTISLIGILGGTRAEFNPGAMVPKAMKMVGIYVGSRDMFEDMNRAFDQHRVEPVIDWTFGFEDAQAAYRHMEDAKHLGKIVIEGP